MTPHERKMIGLYDALADTLGSVEADTLMDLLPRAGWSVIADRYEIERPVVHHADDDISDYDDRRVLRLHRRLAQTLGGWVADVFMRELPRTNWLEVADWYGAERNTEREADAA